MRCIRFSSDTFICKTSPSSTKWSIETPYMSPLNTTVRRHFENDNPGTRHCKWLQRDETLSTRYETFFTLVFVMQAQYKCLDTLSAPLVLQTRVIDRVNKCCRHWEKHIKALIHQPVRPYGSAGPPKPDLKLIACQHCCLKRLKISGSTCPFPDKLKFSVALCPQRP